MKFDQDLCLNLRYDLKKLLWQAELNPRVRCAFGNVFSTELRRHRPREQVVLDAGWIIGCPNWPDTLVPNMIN